MHPILKRAKDWFDWATVDALWGRHARIERRPRRDPRRLELYVGEDDDRVLVGTLVAEDDGFVFTYSRKYLDSGRPLLEDFPEEELRSRRLFPFFEVRVPPVHRADIARLREQKGIAEDDLLGLLGKIGARSVTSPYEFELRAA